MTPKKPVFPINTYPLLQNTIFIKQSLYKMEQIKRPDVEETDLVQEVGYFFFFYSFSIILRFLVFFKHLSGQWCKIPPEV